MNKNGKTAFGVILAIFLGTVLAGTALPPAPIEFVAPSCYDGTDNDGDSPSMIPGAYQDNTDGECIWMPFTFESGISPGEYDGRGLNDPLITDVGIYADEWNGSTGYPTHWEGIKAMYEELGLSNYCSNTRITDSMVHYRDVLNIPDSRTGSTAHQAECGLSY